VATTDTPHLVQNLVPSGSSAPQLEQYLLASVTTSTSTFVPQFWQKAESAAISSPQFLHLIIFVSMFFPSYIVLQNHFRNHFANFNDVTCSSEFKSNFAHTGKENIQFGIPV
jgi:hypothetical protein